jgi:hypothetical protein
VSNDSSALVLQVIFDVGDSKVGPSVLKMAGKSTFEDPSWGAGRGNAAKSNLDDEE